MSGSSPAVVLYNQSGVELDVQNNTAFVTGQSALLIAGVNPSNNTTFALTTGIGGLGMSPLSDTQTVQSAATVTTSGSFTMAEAYDGVQEFVLVVSVGTVTGAGSIQYTIQEFDPTAAASGVFGNSATTVVINSGNAPGVFTATLNSSSSTIAKVTWTVTGTFSATISSVVITKVTPATQQISGSITATNPSVGTDGAAVLGFDTQVGGSVTTAAPTYTTGNLNALSLTTHGGLRIDGVFAVGTSTATATTAMVDGGYVTTAAPTYTNATTNALSLTTAGSLRVDGTGGVFNNQSVGTDGAAALGFDTQVGGKTTTSAPTYTTGNLDALSLTTLGGLRIDGVYAAGTANATAADVMNSGGYVTTAAPTYTTGQLEPLSLTTAGSLRVDGTGGTFNNQSVGTDGAAALGFDTQVGAKVITTVPTYTNGNLQALTMDVGGNLRVVTNKASTSAVTTVSVSNSASTQLLAQNLNRVFASVYNNTGQQLYIKLGTTASSTSFSILLMPNSYWEVPVDYIGEIDALAKNPGATTVLVTELTP